MDILAGLKDKLSFIERFYQSAASPFVNRKRAIDAHEAPFDCSGMDPEEYSGEPPYLDEWLEADECLNLVGQAALSLVQGALREYLDGYLSLRGLDPPTGRGNWFAKYKALFEEKLGIDWDASPIPPVQIEEINLARNDIQHEGEIFGMARRQSKEHFQRFPMGIFIHDVDKALFASHGLGGLRILITEDNLAEAIRRVRAFCEYLEAGG